MMCIRGKLHPAHTGLFSGQVYDVSLVKFCCEPRAEAEGSVFVRATVLTCKLCGSVRRGVKHVPWGQDRFVPWGDPKVSEAEVQRLYRPSRRKEKV